MSWTGSNHYDGTRTQAAARITTAFTEPEDKRQAARALYSQGDVDAAAERLGEIMISGAAIADDYLFMGLLHHALRNPSASIALLRDGIARFPDNAAMHENLAVNLLIAGAPAAAVEAANAALALGAGSPNLYDCLCEAQERLGRPDLAIEAGRKSLDMKDAHFSRGLPLANIPTGRPRPFDPGQPERNLIVYTLWGDDPRYMVPLATNARILPHLFPGWTMRVYHDAEVDPAYLAERANDGVQLVSVTLPPGVPAHRRLLWRFEPIADPNVHRFLIRDADSLLTVKERVAVDAWLGSVCHFHTMRDWYTHTDLLLAGMWGGVGGILPSPGTLMSAYSQWRVETNHIDQDLLTETVWPVVRHSILIHDSIFAPCLGSIPFPPFGALPPGHHIGENAFLNFSKSG